MSDSDDWLYEIVPPNQVEELSSKMEQIYEDETTVFSIVLSAPRSSAIDLCKTFQKAMDGDYMCAIATIRFVGNIVGLIEQELEENGINPYGD
jgi:hypothetical protein